MELKMEQSWKTALNAEFEKPYFSDLTRAVKEAYLKQTIFPTSENIFNAFNLCPLDIVKVVILGQDPYHAIGQAHGLAFSVLDGVKTPPSLKNIYKELKSDLGVDVPETGNLEHWAKQGVLLLNTTLTVEAGQPGSHQGLGWETFTDKIIETVSGQREHVVFLLWGKFAQDKASLIDKRKHLILKTTHPSPLSAYRGFLGSKQFSKTNEYLEQLHLGEINW